MATLYEYFNTDDNAGYYIQTNTQYFAQTFTPSAAHKITSVKLKLFKRGTPVGTITVGIRTTDGDGKPTGSNLCSGTLDPSTLDTTPGSFKKITLGPGSNLSASTKYAIVLSGSWTYDAGNDINWRDKSTGGYAGGDARYSTDSGVTWGDALANLDFMFEEWGDATGTPTVTTQAVTSIVTTTATGNGNITDLGDSAVTQHGHCWNTTGTPNADDDSKKENGAAAATGAFTSAITGLTEGTLYYVRAFATNTAGTAYGEQVAFIAGALVPGEGSGVYAVVQDRFHYVDAYGVERFLKGTVVP